jgi:hypothetical protein
VAREQARSGRETAPSPTEHALSNRELVRARRELARSGREHARSAREPSRSRAERRASRRERGVSRPEEARRRADFDLEAYKTPRPLTGAEQVTAAAKNAATREARGPRARLAVRGDVVGVTVTPVVVEKV